MNDTMLGLAVVAIGAGVAWLGFSGNLPTFLMAVLFVGVVDAEAFPPITAKLLRLMKPHLPFLISKSQVAIPQRPYPNNLLSHWQDWLQSKA